MGGRGRAVLRHAAVSPLVVGRECQSASLRQPLPPVKLPRCNALPASRNHIKTHEQEASPHCYYWDRKNAITAYIRYCHHGHHKSVFTDAAQENHLYHEKVEEESGKKLEKLIFQSSSHILFSWRHTHTKGSWDKRPLQPQILNNPQSVTLFFFPPPRCEIFDPGGAQTFSSIKHESWALTGK